ncbi:hypothetical protein D3C81_932690 [compost metagenome]
MLRAKNRIGSGTCGIHGIGIAVHKFKLLAIDYFFGIFKRIDLIAPIQIDPCQQGFNGPNIQSVLTKHGKDLQRGICSIIFNLVYCRIYGQ